MGLINDYMMVVQYGWTDMLTSINKCSLLIHKYLVIREFIYMTSRSNLYPSNRHFMDYKQKFLLEKRDRGL